MRVLASVIKQDNRLFICQRPASKRHGGLWEFPGGKVEAGESDLAASRRELAEELGVHVLSVGPVDFSVADPGSDFVIEFLPVTIEGDPVCLEHSAVAWVRLTELLAYDLAPSDRRYAEFLLERESRRDDE